MIEEKIIFSSCGNSLVGVLGIPDMTPAPGVILLHGLTNSKDDCPLIKETANMLVADGYLVFRFDFFGSGESPGKMIEKKMSILEQNARDAVEFLLQDNRVSCKIGLVGRSLGGTIAILIAHRPEIRACIILSAAISLEETLGKPTFGKLKRLEKELSKRGEKLPGTGIYKGAYNLGDAWYKELRTYDEKILACLSKLNRVLILATDPDCKVPVDNSKRIFAHASEPKQLKVFNGIDHDYKGVEANVLRMEKEWLDKYLLMNND